ncbi:MAG: hypothetical protein ACK4UJ_07310 [Leptonema sp. (in: bacteria)]
MKRLFLFLFFIFFISCKTSSFFLETKKPEPFVVLTFHENVAPVAILLEESNLKFDIYYPKEPFTENAFALISIEENFPVEKFIEILKYILNYYPGLRYLEIIPSNKKSKNSLLWIGNKTEIAIKKNLKSWNKQDFEKLISLKNEKEVHQFILEKNQINSISKPMGQ